MNQNPNDLAKTNASSAIQTASHTLPVLPTTIPESLTISTPDVDLPISAPASASQAK